MCIGFLRTAASQSSTVQRAWSSRALSAPEMLLLSPKAGNSCSEPSPCKIVGVAWALPRDHLQGPENAAGPALKDCRGFRGIKPCSKRPETAQAFLQRGEHAALLHGEQASIACIRCLENYLIHNVSLILHAPAMGRPDPLPAGHCLISHVPECTLCGAACPTPEPHLMVWVLVQLSLFLGSVPPHTPKVK